MRSSKLWYFLALCMLSVLPLVGCSGSSGGGSKANASNLSVKAVGKVDGSLLAEATKAATALNTVDAIDAQTGTVLGTAPIDAEGNFKDLEFTLPEKKATIIFKAAIAAGTFRSVVPIDLSNPPTAGVIVGSQPVIVYINSETEAIAKAISQELGIASGTLGDDGVTLNSANKDYDDALEATRNNGGLILSYDGNDGLVIEGVVTPGGGGNNEGAAKTAMESCAACHANGKANGVDAVHAVGAFGTTKITMADLAVTHTGSALVNGGADLALTFNVKVNGSNKVNYYNSVGTGYTLNNLNNRTSMPAGYTLTGGTNGNYTITIPGAGANGNTRYMFQLTNTADDALAVKPVGSKVMVIADYPTAPIADVLGNAKSCEACHGSYGGVRGTRTHYDYPAHGGKTCRMCHGASNWTGHTAMMNLGHGIHQSGNMPEGTWTAVNPNGGKHGTYSVHLPTYMQNCSICHESGSALTAANAKPVSFELCMSCHQSWDGFNKTKEGATYQFHRTYDKTKDCMTCHDGANVGTMHNKANDEKGLTSGRGGLIVGGVDLAVAEGAKINQEITGVTINGNKLSITWKATYNNSAVNPCNATPTTSAPAFAYAAVPASGKQLAVSAQNFSFLKGFFQGDDIVNADNGNASPGQPNSTNLVFTGDSANTTCSDNVATTVITLTDAEVKLTGNARVGLQGRPAMKTADGRTYLVRAKSPVYDFKLADGSAMKPGSAVARRAIADIDACLKCHVGSMYQHGGNRIDSVELCIICHNEASSEQNIRVGLGITSKDKTYDGQTGQTYGFKTMLHRVHASGTENLAGKKALAIYRGNGIYGFAMSQDYMYNWPGVGTQTIFGSDPAVTRNHNFATADYPRPLTDCSACHVKGFNVMPDATKAVATTIDAGTAPWSNQLDDTLIGPAAAACISCHAGSAATAHAYQNSWAPAKLEKGRQTVIDSAR